MNVIKRIFKNKKYIILLMIVVISIILLLNKFRIQKNNRCMESMQTINLNKNKNKNIVVLDAGHGYPDGGAISENGIKEADLNLDITLKTKKILEDNGIKVILTRKDRNSISDANKKNIREKKISDIKNRVKIGNNSFADVFVSIHLNKIKEKQYNGWQTFYKEKNKESKILATNIQNNISKIIKKENRRVPLKINNVYILNHLNIPGTIVECGFLSNEEETKLLQNNDYQEKLALGISNGIIEYLKE